MKKARVLLAVVFAAVAVSMSACSNTITGADCVDPGGNSFKCE
jgi:predicted small secreted protein